ncbi:MAG TPA: hypothetical protein VHL11_16485 [Phototrophicaceae bacterium]|jgi:hypothetical protein|nr:hypothetical protein [Phototrophicaceae bacterium]
MQKFKASSPNAETIGQLLLSFFHNLQYKDIEPVLTKYKLDHLEPAEWYPQQLGLDIFKEIAEGGINVSDNLVAIGMKAAEYASFPPETDSIEKVLQSLGYRGNRNTPPGEGVIPQVFGEGHALVTNNTPYPDDNMFGYLWGLLKRFVPPGVGFIVSPMDSQKRSADEALIFELRWGVGMIPTETRSDEKHFIAAEKPGSTH